MPVLGLQPLNVLLELCILDRHTLALAIQLLNCFLAFVSTLLGGYLVSLSASTTFLCIIRSQVVSLLLDGAAARIDQALLGDPSQIL